MTVMERNNSSRQDSTLFAIVGIIAFLMICAIFIAQRWHLI